MSKIVLCETQEAQTAYTIEKINRTFQSYEEFCWLLEHYLIFFLTEGLDHSLKNYLREELNLTVKSDDTVQQVKEIINFRNYFNADEKIQFQQKLRTTYLYSAAKKQKMLADLYLAHRLYLRALLAYQRWWKTAGQLRPSEKAEVLYHMGLCQSRMFCFEEAKKYFMKALALKEQKEIQEAYFTAAYLSGDYHSFVEDGSKISFSEDRCKVIYDNLKKREEEIRDQESFVKRKKIDYHRKKADDIMARRLTKAALRKWKDEYKAEII